MPIEVRPGVTVHLVDGTFELFRCFHGAPRAIAPDGAEVGAARGLLATLVALLGSGATHVAVAFDSVVAPLASSRPPTTEGLIAAQTPLAADVVRALGLVIWPSGRYQADELLAAGAARYAIDERVAQVVICATDNDFDQCVRGRQIVVLDRVRNVITDEDAVRSRWGVAPAQLPDLFALVGDRSDGVAGVPGWGKRSAAALIGRYGSLDAVPTDEATWDVELRGRERLAASFAARRAEAVLCRDLLRLRTDLPIHHTLDDLAWRGAHRDPCRVLAERIGDDSPLARVSRWR